MAQRKTVVVTAAGLAEMPAADTAPVPAYGIGGVVAGCRLWIGEATTGADSSWSVDLTSAGFAASPKIQAQAISAGTAVGSSAQATVTARSATAASGFVTLPATIVLGGLAIARAAAGLTVMVIAVGP